MSQFCQGGPCGGGTGPPYLITLWAYLSGRSSLAGQSAKHSASRTGSAQRPGTSDSGARGEECTGSQGRAGRGRGASGSWKGPGGGDEATRWAGPHPHDAHVVHARQPLVALLRAVDLLPQLLCRPDVVPPRRVHPLEGQPAGLRAEARAGAGGKNQDPGLGWGSGCWGTGLGPGAWQESGGIGRQDAGGRRKGERSVRLGRYRLGPRDAVTGSRVKGPGCQMGPRPRGKGDNPLARAAL